MNRTATPICAADIMHRLDALATCSEESGALTRTFLTPQHKAAALMLKGWMQEAGMQADFDAIGNMLGRYEGTSPGLPALLVGSHFDTVRNAGKYDGMLGIVAGIACVRALHRLGERLPFAIEIIGFGDEEGVRFGATLLGSRALTGTFDHAVLDNVDSDGIAMAEALRAYGLDPGRVVDAARHPEQVLGFMELHIEQGPVLESEDLPVGVVTAIDGATRFQVGVTGMAGHAGTVPMALRRDAAAAAAEALLFIETRCRREEGLVGTVGQLRVPGGAVNVIPGSAEFSMDIRAGDDNVRDTAISDIVNELEAAVERAGLPVRRLCSGAGHDAMAFSGFTDMVMLFVRCGNGGISHHPDEVLSAADAETATRVLLDFIRRFEPR